MFMKIKGIIEETVFRNNENGYAILVIGTETGKVTVSGKFPIVGEGEQIEAEGEFKINPKYGKQFVVESVKISRPTTKEQIEKYLSSGLVSGVGPVTAKAIVSKFGEKTLEIIETNPIELAKVKGIGLKKAMDIVHTIMDIRKMQDAVIFLQKFDVSINMAVKIYEKYKNTTEIILTKNPYKLIEDIEGIGFKTADKIAVKMGIDEDSEFRMRAGLIHYLTEVAEKTGSTLVDQNLLTKKTAEMLSLEFETNQSGFEKVLTKMLIEGIVREVVSEETRLALTKYFVYEKTIATTLQQLALSAKNVLVDIDADLAEFERMKKIELHETQKHAIKVAIEGGVTVITGGPGTGKTTILTAILQIFKTRGMKCLLAAPTGRAAKRLTETTGEEAATIHRLLESNFGAFGFRTFAHNEHNKLETDVVIVDEASMLDSFIASSLLRAVPHGTRFIFVGDKDQLPSVGAGNVLSDIILCGKFPVVELTRIFRQGKESLIVENAHLINSGEMPILDKKDSDFFYICKTEPAQILEEIKELASKRLPAFMKTDWKNIQVIAPTRAGLVGVENINIELQAILNPDKGFGETTVFGKIFRVGDRVMQTANNYEQKWVKFEFGISTEGAGVFNGDIGYVAEINKKTGEVIVDFEDGRRANYSIAEVGDLTLAYAITIHKSQGSEFDIVVIPIQSGNPYLFNRNLFYTAVTRAKKLVVLIGSKKSISYMVWNTKMTKRTTLLREFLKEQVITD